MFHMWKLSRKVQVGAVHLGRYRRTGRIRILQRGKRLAIAAATDAAVAASAVNGGRALA